MRLSWRQEAARGQVKEGILSDSILKRSRGNLSLLDVQLGVLRDEMWDNHKGKGDSKRADQASFATSDTANWHMHMHMLQSAAAAADHCGPSVRRHPLPRNSALPRGPCFPQTRNFTARALPPRPGPQRGLRLPA